MPKFLIIRFSSIGDIIQCMGIIDGIRGTFFPMQKSIGSPEKICLLSWPWTSASVKYGLSIKHSALKAC